MSKRLALTSTAGAICESIKCRTTAFIAPNGTHYNAEDVTDAGNGVIYIHSVWTLQKVLLLVSVPQLVNLGGCLSAPLRGGGEMNILEYFWF